MKRKNFLLILLCFFMFSINFIVRLPNVKVDAAGNSVATSSFEAWKFAGGWNCTSTYVSSGVNVNVPGQDTEGGEAWARGPRIPNNYDNGFSVKNGKSVSFEFAAAFYDNNGNNIAKSVNNGGYALDVIAYNNANKAELARLRIWVNSGEALNGTHSYCLVNNLDWSQVNGGDIWIKGDATPNSSFYIQFDTENLFSSYVGGSNEITPLDHTGEYYSKVGSKSNNVEEVYFEIKADGGFISAANIILKSVNGQSLANNGGYFTYVKDAELSVSTIEEVHLIDDSVSINVSAYELFSTPSVSGKVVLPNGSEQNLSITNGVAQYKCTTTGVHTFKFETTGANGNKVIKEVSTIVKSSLVDVTVSVPNNTYKQQYNIGDEITIVAGTTEGPVANSTITIIKPDSSTISVNPNDKFRFEAPGMYKIKYYVEDDQTIPNTGECIIDILVPDVNDPEVTVTVVNKVLVGTKVIPTITVVDETPCTITVTLTDSKNNIDTLSGDYSFTKDTADTYTLTVSVEDDFGNSTQVVKEIEVVVPSFTVTFDNNGHGEKPADLSEQTTLPAEFPTLSEEGWLFEGWYLDSNFEQEAVESGVIVEDTTLYAKWTEITYTVSYMNNGHGEKPADLSEVTSLPTDLPVLEEAGWIFEGWFTDENLTTNAVSGTKITEDTTLYAKWREITYTISFVNNDHGEALSDVENVTKLPVLPELSETGWIFEGWYLDSEFEELAVSNAPINANTTLYAKWTEITYTISFETINGTTPDEITEVTKIPENLPQLTEEGWIFEGWYLDSNYDVLAEANEAIFEDTTLYAKWSIEKYTISFDGVEQELEYDSVIEAPADPMKEGHTFLGWYMGEVEFEEGLKATSDMAFVAKYQINKYTISFDGVEQELEYNSVIEAPANPTKEGYTFSGWYMGEIEFEEGLKATSNMAFVSKYQINKYTISFDGVEQELEYNSVIEAPADPMKEGHTFLGWYMGEVEFEEGLKATSDMAFVSKFELNTYKVSFNNNGHGTPLFDLPNKSALPDPLPVLIEDGYTFEGWFTDSELTTAAVAGKAITADTTLYAKWTENLVEFTITFVTNIGEAPAEIVSSIIPNELPVLTAEGYTFEGWYLDADCTIEVVKGATLPANIKLYAKWEATDILTPEHTCDFTGEWVSDETHHWHECECGEIDTKVEHSGGEATLTEKAKCEVCGVEYGELLKEPTSETPTDPEQPEQPGVSTEELEDMPYDPNYDPFTDVTIQPSGGCNGGCKGSLIPTLFGTIGLLCSVLVIKTKKNKH